ncbi:Uncharacterised protein [Mycobacteroides abscessus subsp. abscessus]|nr:Uncharacterised protein [Mycobacteroides abscessus subsp. abscessus]
MVDSADALCDDEAFRLASALVDDASPDALSDPLSDVEQPAIPTITATPAQAASMRVRRIVLLDILVSLSVVTCWTRPRCKRDLASSNQQRITFRHK